MQDLDDLEAMKKLDPSGVLDSTAMFSDQCNQAWRESSVIQFPNEYKTAQNVVVCGMGGSRFTPKTIKELFRDHITVPYEIVEDYTLPAYVGKNSLVMLSSFSGNTEEVIACGIEGYARGAFVTGLAQGGKVIELLKQHNSPYYQFESKFNPCGQPRIGGGYLLFGHIGLLVSLGFLNIHSDEIHAAISYSRVLAAKYLATVPETKNKAKQFAKILQDKHPFIITSEFLRGFGNGFANQINETAKMMSDYRYIPELNHHLLEGLKRPGTVQQNGLFVFFLSNFYTPPVQNRYAITADVVKKQHVGTYIVALEGASKAAQVLEAFTLAAFTTFYMAMLYDTDPVAIPWVDYFKQQLKKIER